MCADTPITEAGFTGIGVGAAFMGLKPIVEFMTWNFALQARAALLRPPKHTHPNTPLPLLSLSQPRHPPPQSIDHVVNSAAKTLYMSAGAIPVPIVFRGPNGAAAGVAAQHSQCFAAWYASVPGLKVLAPYDAEDARGLLKAAIRDPDPVVFLENELLYGQEFPVSAACLSPDFVLPIGRAAIARAGTDVTLVAFGKMVGVCLAAADALAAQGISAEVVNLRSLRPLDRATIVASARKTGRLVVAEEGWPVCGVGAEIIAVACEEAFDYLDAPPERVTGVDVPMPYAEGLEKAALPRADDIVRAAKLAVHREGERMRAEA